jgi:hypothetical protein
MSTIFANAIMGRSTTCNMDLAVVQNFGPALIPAFTVVQFVGPVHQGRGPGTFGFIDAEHVPPPVGVTWVTDVEPTKGYCRA